MNEFFEDSEVEKSDITKKNWASVAMALKKHNEDMGALRTELDNLSRQFNALAARMQVMDQEHAQSIARSFNGGPTAE
jgi:hypothetical protein